ncbi:tryptophan synthase, alpha chain [Actinopolyspora xinjiangensis]|uniref:Tryptophan synthase alpha chain n=1 Tax=Actinopolyspora xinjiangensis TaxID=405564 RepID=A0A1H0SNG8_9ACTN|nr:tryptophan synthase subunit alpha [Actinopolyspora xinjiangensis]SDP43291.1 tryptophan synthase, alpha chain [Actinopolyspora xinjiangensis]
MSLHEVFRDCAAQRRAALIGYLPAGFPTVPDSAELFRAMVRGDGDTPGCDVVEIGIPYSDPVMDGPTIQAAGGEALRNGFRVRQLFDLVATVAEAGAAPVVMTYWNPVHRYGPDAFARDLAAAGGLGVITPDLIPDEADEWLTAARRYDLDRIFLVAPSSTDRRLAMTAEAGSGFLYAASVMGVTGARDSVSGSARDLVRRTREHTELPIGVGLGVRTAEHAAEVGSFADGVIVGSAFVSRVRREGTTGVAEFAAELGRGVRSNPAPVPEVVD